jgi:3-phenylpropionate/trans-cinnamate dioxygenase ferredoxin reductase subunit
MFLDERAVLSFFADQYDLGMEYLGHVEPGGYDRVVFRGDVSGREFIAFWLRDNRVLAGMNVNVWDVTDQIKALILSRSPAGPSLASSLQAGSRRFGDRTEGR